MVLGFDRLAALRECCRDQAAFDRLKQILAGRDLAIEPSATADACCSDCYPAPARPNLLQGVAEATSQLLTHPDFTQAIDTALATLGRSTAVDRVYIFAIHDHPETGEPATSQQFEWVRESIVPQIDNPILQNFTYATHGLTRWHTLLELGQPFSTLVRDLPELERQDLILQDVLSLLIVPIHSNGHLWGFIGFDDCQTERQWSKDEAAALQLMAASIGGAIARQQTEAANRQSKARYKAMLDASPDLMFRLDRQGRYLDLKGDSRLELPREAIVGRYLSDLLPPAVANLSLNAIQQTLATGELQTCKYQLPHTIGMRDYEARIVVSGRDEVLAIVQDVTDRQRVEAELRTSEERLQSFFRATFEAVVIHDFSRILDVNPAAEQLLGYAADRLIGMSVLDLVAADSVATVLEHWQSLSAPDQPYAYEAWGQKQDGTQFMAAVSSKVIQYKQRQVRVASIRDITDSKRAEQAIRQSEARNRALVNAIPDLMFRIDRHGTYLDCKAEHDSEVLIPPQELIGKSVYQVLPPDLAQQRMYYVEKALTTGETQNFEFQLRLHSGSLANQLYQSLSGNAQSQLSASQTLRNYEARVVVSGEDEALAIVRDITDRKLSEAALRLSEEKFSKAFRSSPNPMTIATLDEGRLIEVNDSFLRAVGYEREVVIGKTVYELNIWANPADRDRMTQALRQHSTIRNLECQFRAQSGTIFTSLFSAEAIHIGGELCLIDVAVDITDRLRTEQQLWAAAERDRLLGEIALTIRQSLNLEQILHTTVAEVRQFLHADRVYVGHTDCQGMGRVLAESVDPQWRSIMGLSNASEQQLQEFKTIFAEGQTHIVNDAAEMTQYPAVARHFADYQIRASLGVPLMLNTQIFGLLVVNQCAAPRQWEPFEVHLLERLATQVSIAIQQAQLYRQVQDLNAGLEQQVTERTAQLEQKTVQLQQKMEELQELNQLKDEFLNAFSHDLRTPIMGISLVIGNLLNQGGETIPVMRSILERMMQSGSHQLHLINSLLQAYSSETQGVILHYELVQLSLLTQIIVEDLEPLIGKNQATFENCVPPDLPLVNADPMQLRRVFENLITNALHHNPPGVHLILDARVEEEMIWFTLQDNGIGMTPDVSSHLFERYVRGAPSRHSTGIGLGLYLCRQIITAHGGQIGVHSTPRMGSTFWLTLPLAISSVAQPHPTALAEA